METHAQQLTGVVILDAGPTCPELPLLEAGGGAARAVVWPGVGATLRTFHRLRLRPGGRTRLLRHDGEAVYYVVRGHARAHDGAGPDHPVGPGSMVHIEAGTAYAFHAGDEGCEIVGGPCPNDPQLYG